MTHRIGSVGLAINVIGSAVTAVGMLERAHWHWLCVAGSIANLLGLGIQFAPTYSFVSREFVPTYGRLERLCAAYGVPCGIRTQRTTWVFRCSVGFLFLTICLFTLGLVLRQWYGSLELIGLGCEIALLGVLAFGLKLLSSTQNEADVLLDQLAGRSLRQPLGPPNAARFLLLLIPIRHREHLIGDLEEEYIAVVLPKYGLKKARAWYWWQVLLSLVPILWSEVKRVAGFVLLLRALH